MRNHLYYPCMQIMLSLFLATFCLQASAMEFDSNDLLPFSTGFDGPGMLESLFSEFRYWWRG